MKKQILILRLISALFLIFAITRLATFFWVKLNWSIMLHVLFFSFLSLSVAVGLLKRYQWARWLATALLTIGLARSIVGAREDILLLAARYDVTTSALFAGAPLWFFILASMLWAVIASSVWWLAKSSTNELFNSKG